MIWYQCDIPEELQGDSIVIQGLGDTMLFNQGWDRQKQKLAKQNWITKALEVVSMEIGLPDKHLFASCSDTILHHPATDLYVCNFFL